MSRSTARSARRLIGAAVSVVAAAALLAGCGEKKDKAAGPPAAKVNQSEITVSQVDLVLAQQRNLRPEQAEAAGRQVLERLIDQELAIEKAVELKVDRDPRVLQQIEAARREVIARAYFEKIGEAAARPTADEIGKYYADKPALFSQRRIYNLQEILIEARPDQVTGLREQLAASKNVGEFVEYLKANDFRFAGSQAVRAAEQLPLNSLEAIYRMQVGQAMMLPWANGVQVVVLAGSRSQPVGEEQARPAIEQFILNERKRKLVEDQIKSLRAAATVQYIGKYAESAASAPASAASGN
jgi:EpsD family peptidyl-prolyl cis-trans isomerase